jgi:hypothetical protein
MHVIEVGVAERQFLNVFPSVGAGAYGSEQLQAIGILLVELVVVPGKEDFSSIWREGSVAEVFV